jgi:hypothetical protein
MLVNAGKFSAGRFGGGRFTSGKFGQRAGGGGPSVADVAAIMATRDGYWAGGFDPATGRLFQTATGTTAAVGQPVGLAIDNSRAAALGPELWTTPFTNTSTGTGTASESAGVASISGTDASNRGRLSTASAAVTVGGLLRLSLNTLTFSGAGQLFWNVSGSPTTGVSGDLIPPATGPFTTFFSPPASPRVNSLCTSGGGATVTLTASVRQIAGNHATQATALARPTLAQTGGIWNLTNDGGDSLADTLPAGTYTRVWVDTAGVVTTTPGLSGGAVNVIETTMTNVVDVLWATSLTGADLATVETYMAGLV